MSNNDNAVQLHFTLFHGSGGCSFAGTPTAVFCIRWPIDRCSNPCADRCTEATTDALSEVTPRLPSIGYADLRFG
jgi:hypothetical protein